MSKNIKIELTKREAECLLGHFETDLSFGVGGTFGDGENSFKGEIRIAERIIEKLKKAMELEKAER